MAKVSPSGVSGGRNGTSTSLHHPTYHHHHHHHLTSCQQLLTRGNSPIGQTFLHHRSPTTTPTSIKKEPPPTPSSSYSENEEPFPTSSDLFLSPKVKRKINFSQIQQHPTTTTKNQPATVARRNARERNRVKQVNNGFAALKQHIPLGHRAKKMSKVETLRCAVDYIRNLQCLLDPTSSTSDSHHYGDLSIPSCSSTPPPSSSSSSSSSIDELTNTCGGGCDPTILSIGPTSFLIQQPQPPPPLPPPPPPSSSSTTSSSTTQGLYDFESYPVSPDDEELLDAISIWQET